MKRILFVLCFFFAGLCSAQQTCTRSLSGVNYQSGTNNPYPFVALDTTRITAFQNPLAQAATLAAGVTNPNFGACSVFSVLNLGQGTVTITCNSCTINGATTLALTYLQGADIYGDGDNYVAIGVGGGGSGGGGCATNPFDGGCMLAGNPSIDFFPGMSSGGAGTGWFVQYLNNQANFKVPINVTVGLGNAGVITWICGTVPSLGSGISVTAPASCTPYILILPSAPGSGYLQLSNVGSTVTGAIEPAVNLGPSSSDVSGVTDILKGGTGASSASAALINLFPTPVRPGDWLYWNGTSWTNFGGCQTSTCIPSENGAGAPGYIQTPIPVVDGGLGVATVTTNCLMKGNGTSAVSASTVCDNATDVLMTEPLYGANSTILTSPTTISTGTLTTTGLVLPPVPISTTVRGHCSLIWEQSTAAATVTFGLGMNHAPTDLWVAPPTIWNGTSVAFGAYTTITGTSATNITSTITPAATATGYKVEFDFTLNTGATNPVTLTVYGLTSNISDALVVEPGSACGWEP
jgi:hypothetical protein